jgi:hypothetical protein
MNTQIPTVSETQPFIADPALEALAVAHYEHVYALCHAFHADPAACLSLTNQVFRDATTSPEYLTVCRQAVRAIARRPGELPVPSCSLRANLAWLLKEVTGLRYSEIGEVLGLELDQIKQTIAEVREALLSAMSEQAAA